MCTHTHTHTHQGRSQDFLKGGSKSSIELPEAGVWGYSPQPLRDFQHFNESKLSKLLYFMQKSTLIIKHISAFGMKLVLDKAT